MSAPAAARYALREYALVDRIGSGGMGEVWRGYHARSSLPVAIKLVRPGRAASDSTRRALFAEMHAAARLVHPHIVELYDYGLVDADADAASAGALVEGSPYLVMELASCGSLADAASPTSWAELRSLLLALLDALAHAHARGVVHRDVKPANVIVSGPEDRRPGVKLTDFGLAHGGAGDEEERAGHVAGTPRYMAPEQLLGRWRDFGPWTDLYALGCVAFELAAGHAPFAGEPGEVRASHLHAAPAPLRARFPVPAELDGWIRKMLVKDRRARLQRAADAAWALRRLAPPRPDAALDDLGSATAGEQQPLTCRTVTLDVLGWATRRDATDAPPEDPGPLRSAPSARPPVPASWRREDSALSTPWRRGWLPSTTGLGIYGARATPFVGREAERDRLWTHLRGVVASGRPRLVVLTGPSGIGKTRLAEWIAERAHETGAATVLSARHHATVPGPGALAEMVARHFGTGGLEPPRVRARLADELSALGLSGSELAIAVDALAPVLGAGAHRPDPSPGPEHVHPLLRRVVAAIAGSRPALLQLDDVQWGLDTVRWVTGLLASTDGAPAPVLAVATARDDALADAPSVCAALDDLRGREDVDFVGLCPLGRVESARLVRGLLGVRGELAARIEARASGLPLFAVQAVGWCVGRGMLQPGEGGWRLARGARLALPQALSDIWLARVTEVLTGQPDPDARLAALELAAVSGAEHAPVGAWRAACATAGLSLTEHDLLDLVGCLSEARLAVARPGGAGPEGGWGFTHALLAESLQGSARSRGRWAAWHAVWADLLAARCEGPASRVAERLARHLLEADRPAEALEPLLDASRARFEQGQDREAGVLLDRYQTTLDALAVGAVDPRRGEATLLEAAIAARHHDDHARAAELAREVGQRATEHGWAALRAEAAWLEAQCARLAGRPDEARTLYRVAMEGFEAVGDERGRARAETGLARYLLGAGRAREAGALLHAVVGRYVRLGAQEGVADTCRGLGLVARSLRWTAAALALSRIALRAYRARGLHLGVATTLNDVGDAHRWGGQLAAAAAAYREAIAIDEAFAHGETDVVRLNLGLTLALAGALPEARRILEPCGRRLAESGWPVCEAGASAALLVCCAGAGDWDAWDHHLARVAAIATPIGLDDPDLLLPLEVGRTIAAAAGQGERAEGVDALLAALAAAGQGQSMP